MRETHLREARQTVKLGLVKVVHDLFPGERLKTSYSILEGVFCSLDGSVLSTRESALIGQRLKEWVERDHPIRFLGRENGFHIYEVEGYRVQALYPAFTRPSQVEAFVVIPFSDGFIVDFGDIDKGDGVPVIPPVKLQATYEEGRRWLDLVGLEVVADVNDFITSGRATELIGIAEALHEKKISAIADSILTQQRALRVLLIAGPSSSGKTSFLSRLNTQLFVNGFRPVPLSLDNYFLDRDQTPLDSDGKPDFERLNALDLPLLQSHLQQLVGGQEVRVPTFDFVSGRRGEQTTTLSVSPREILVIEGIHALNPELTAGVQRNQLFEIYVSALSGLHIDLVNRVPTTEVRLIRRLVRDDRTRGIPPEQTIDRWGSVRRGEYDNIFRYQERADVMFNTSLLYEMNAMRPLAEAALARISDDSQFVATRDRLLNLLGFFDPIDTAAVPLNSLIREFIGGSVYFPSDRTH